MVKTTKKQNKQSNINWKIIGVVMLVAIIMATIGSCRVAGREAYAKRNNCTWRATGTMYGDNRDFVCVKLSEDN